MAEHPHDKRSTNPRRAKRQTAETGTGYAITLRANQVMALLPQRMGAIRLNVRSGDAHTDRGILTANDAALLYLQLSNAAESWPKDKTYDAVTLLAQQNQFDPVADYLNGITAEPLPMEQWQRLDLHLLGVDDPIAAEFLPRFFVSAVARVVVPGCDVRQSPVLVGPQWRGKTMLGRILFGAENWISGVGDLGTDSQMRLHTAWGVELAELDGITRQRDQESLKAFLTETVDVIRRPYDKAPARNPRRFVFWGTSNGAALRDSTGSTRFVTIPIPDRMLPLGWAEQHRDALWARALEQYNAGMQWNHCGEAVRDAIADRNANHTVEDPWRDCIAQTLERRALELQLPVKVEDLLRAVDVPKGRQGTSEGTRVRRIAESLGWVHERRGTKPNRKAGLWPPPMPQEPQGCRTPCHSENTSRDEGSDACATGATAKPEEFEKQVEQDSPASSVLNGAELPQVLSAFAVAPVASPPKALQRKRSGALGGVASGMAPVGSSWDAADDGDDPAWGSPDH